MEPATHAANLARRVRVIELSVDDFLTLLDGFKEHVIDGIGVLGQSDADVFVMDARRSAEDALDALGDAAKSLQDLSEELIQED